VTFIKSYIASIAASASDYLITIIAVQWLGLNIVAAGIIGTISGGVIYFSLGRQWVFNKNQSTRTEQVKRYFIVWIGNLLLNAIGLYVMNLYVDNYIVTKIVVSVSVAVLYNYPLQKNYVFEN